MCFLNLVLGRDFLSKTVLSSSSTKCKSHFKDDDILRSSFELYIPFMIYEELVTISGIQKNIESTFNTQLFHKLLRMQLIYS